MKTFECFITEVINNDVFGRLNNTLETSSDEVYFDYGISYNIVKTVRRFYDNTNIYNKYKINKMISEDLKNFYIVYDMVLTKCKNEGINN